MEDNQRDKLAKLIRDMQANQPSYLAQVVQSLASLIIINLLQYLSRTAAVVAVLKFSGII